MIARRPILATVAWLCVLAGGLVFSAAPAVAAPEAPAIESESVASVSAESASLEAQVNPGGAETTYHFQYGTSEAYGQSTPESASIGSDDTGHPALVHIQGLRAATTYHYRIVASNSQSPAGGTTGPDQTFTTQTAGGEFALPDGRQWELVTPPNKRGALIEPLSHQGVPIQASVDGRGITYDTNVPTEQGAQGYVLIEQVLSERGAQGWSSRDISPPRGSETGALYGLPDFYLFSGDLSSSLVYPYGEDTVTVAGSTSTLLSDRASEQTPYIRRESLCDAPASASECYLPVLTGKEGFADVPPGTLFGQYKNLQYKNLPEYFGGVEIGGVSPDMRHVAIETGELSATASNGIPGNGTGEIYEWSAGVPAGEALQLVSVLPESEGGGPAQRGAIIGEITQREAGGSRHAISNDGSRIVWKEIETGLYVRDTVRKETVRLGGPSAEFEAASSDGSRVIFAGSERLTAQSGTNGFDLYECRIVEEAGKLKCDLTDLTPQTGGQSAEFQGGPGLVVVGVSEDASYVYFVANGVLGDGAGRGAAQGTCTILAPPNETCNLYEYHDGATTFITTLSSEDDHDWWRPAVNTARVSPDGRYVAFMSDRSLTGYDNRDASSGKPDMEVYLYDSVSGRLACASCNPTGSRPTGVEAGNFKGASGTPHYANLVDILSGEQSWVAANLPGGVVVHSGGALYQPRALSDSGRVFFNSSDALVPQDVNGQEDVYEFEPAGVGSCTSSSQTFHASANSCTSLISSGASPEESGFMDASEGGGDVFFITNSRLTSQDYDTGPDVYDAHECTVSVPCVAQPVAPPPCSSGDSCKASPSPQPAIFGAPASATFAGAGNIVASPAAGVVRGKSLTRAQKLASALRACRQRPKRKRAACEKQARKRYGVRGARRAAAGATGKGQG
jgi:WD40-like Beta Propeller Repeat